jgi:hypothetical protein
MVQPNRAGPRAALAALVALALLLAPGAGCRVGGEESPPPGADAAQLRITADHGATALLEAPVAPGRSVLRTLRDQTEIDTSFGGGFVSGMFGRSSDASGRRDWFFFVNGVLAPIGARQARVPALGDVWWDYRPWGALRDPWAVVGAWPAPFAGREVAADPPLRDALRNGGARVVRRSPWRVRVGADAELRRREPAWAEAAEDPTANGLSAGIRGGRIIALSEDGEELREVAGAGAVAVALPTDGDASRGVLMVVAGRTARHATRAAATIATDPGVLAGRYAVVFDAEGRAIHAAGQGEL